MISDWASFSNIQSLEKNMSNCYIQVSHKIRGADLMGLYTCGKAKRSSWTLKLRARAPLSCSAARRAKFRRRMVPDTLDALP